MKTLDRADLDALVRQLEAGAYSLAVRLAGDPEAAGDILVEAFRQVAPYFARSQSLSKLRKQINEKIHARLGGEADLDASGSADQRQPSDTLHLRLVDIVEEHQADEPLGRRKVLFASLGVALVLVALGTYAGVRLNALAAARPTVKDTNPASDAREVPVQGSFWVAFSHAPSAKPSITINPPDGVFDPANWDGHTVLVTYDGLHLATTYTLTVRADYRTAYQDTGHFVQQWRFTTEGYPVLVKADPANGGTGVFRNGQISLEFNHRPPVTPIVSIDPAAPEIQPGAWTGSTFNLSYSGLKPLTTYQITAFVNYGTPRIDIHRTWSFTTEVGAPPQGTPVIWYLPGGRINPGNDQIQRFVALNWQGDVIGTTYQSNSVRQVWDGSIIIDQNATAFDTNGNFVAKSMYGAIAEDSRTMCSLATVDGSGTQWVFVGRLGEQMRRVGPIPGSTYSSYGIVACSVTMNRVVLSYGEMSGISSLLVLDLRTGSVVYRHLYASYPTQLIASRDCRYIAEEIPSYSSDGTRTSSSSVIRRLSDGAVVSRLPNRVVLAFSWDGRRIVTSGTPGAVSNDIELLDWQSGHVLWTHAVPAPEPGYEPVFATAQPNGADVAVAFGSPSATGDIDQLWLVSANGSPKQVLSSPFQALFFSGY